jgi:protein-S-isoprenylcysteine O-methyltransferase Ste14
MKPSKAFLTLLVLGAVPDWHWTVNAFVPSSSNFSFKPKTKVPNLTGIQTYGHSRGTKASTILLRESEKGLDPGPGSSSDKKSISEVFAALQANISSGELGSRGEIYFILQMALVLCILFGNVPVIGNALFVILGPGSVLVGGTVVTLGVIDLGTNLTPWPKPPKEGSLVTEGLVFNEIRHPIYSGLLFLMFGLSMWSGSAMRVLLCVVLRYLLDFKSDLEEDELIKTFGSDYITYRERVQGKFIPYRLTQGIHNAATMIGGNDEMEVQDDSDLEVEPK